MSLRLKRNEGLTEGLQRISKELLRDLLQSIGQDRLTAAQMHDARKIIKNLRAMLRLTRGAMRRAAQATTLCGTLGKVLPPVARRIVFIAQEYLVAQWSAGSYGLRPRDFRILKGLSII
jgi:spore maturation protein SpmA